MNKMHNVNYWEWMKDNNKTVYEASIHFDVNVKQVWEQINERNKNREN